MSVEVHPDGDGEQCQRRGDDDEFPNVHVDAQAAGAVRAKVEEAGTEDCGDKGTRQVDHGEGSDRFHRGTIAARFDRNVFGFVGGALRLLCYHGVDDAVRLRGISPYRRSRSTV